MDILTEGMERIGEKLIETYGADYQMEEGEVQVFLCSNCVVTLKKEGEALKIDICGNAPIPLEYTCRFYE